MTFIEEPSEENLHPHHKVEDQAFAKRQIIDYFNQSGQNYLAVVSKCVWRTQKGSEFNFKKTHAITASRVVSTSVKALLCAQTLMQFGPAGCRVLQKNNCTSSAIVVTKHGIFSE